MSEIWRALRATLSLWPLSLPRKAHLKPLACLSFLSLLKLLCIFTAQPDCSIVLALLSRSFSSVQNQWTSQGQVTIPIPGSVTMASGTNWVCLLLGSKAVTNLDSILKSRDIALPTKVRIVKAMYFSSSHVQL